MTTRTVKAVAIVGAAALLLGAFVAAPAAAKKKKKKAPAPAACAPYTPGEFGAGKPITLVTDAATAEKPVEVALTTQAGLGTSSEAGEGHDDGATTHDYTNLQVDSASSSTGLYVILEFSPTWDYDLFLRDAFHTSIEYSAGFGPLTSGTDRAASGVGSESVNGVPVADCQGFTVDVSNATTPGGEVTLKYWLGDAT